MERKDGTEVDGGISGEGGGRRQWKRTAVSAANEAVEDSGSGINEVVIKWTQFSEAG